MLAFMNLNESGNNLQYDLFLYRVTSTLYLYRFSLFVDDEESGIRTIHYYVTDMGDDSDIWSGHLSGQMETQVITDTLLALLGSPGFMTNILLRLTYYPSSAICPML